MIWVWIAIAIPALFVLTLASIRFHLEAEYLSPLHVSSTAKISFFGLSWKKEIHFQKPAESDTSSTTDDSTERVTENPAGVFLSAASSESGFVVIPESWTRKVTAARRRFRPAFKKFLLDPVAWKIISGYLFAAGWRLLRTLNLRLRYLSIGLEDVLSMGKLAAVISVLRGIFPALACPIEYRFCQSTASARVQCTAGFSALKLCSTLFMLLFTFPWFRLAARFRAGWRNPELNGWQRRIASAL